MSTFKLGILSLFILIFSLTSFSTTYASNPMVVNKVASSIEMAHWVQIDAPVSPNIRYLTNIPMTIAASADNSAGDLVKLTLLINGQAVATSASPSLTSTYTPTSAGSYTITAVVGYTDGSYMLDTMTFTVRTGGIRQVLVPVQILTP